MYWKVWHWNSIFYRSKTMEQSSRRNKKLQIPWGIKVRIESWVSKSYHCKISKLFIKHVGYLEQWSILYVSCVWLYACNIFLFTFVLLLVDIKLANLISFFPVMDVLAITRGLLFFFCLFVYLFALSFSLAGRNEIILVIFIKKSFFVKTFLTVLIFSLHLLALFLWRLVFFFLLFFR